MGSEMCIRDRALHYFLSSTGHVQVDHMILAGGTASIPGIDAMLHAQTAIPTRVANPFAAMGIHHHRIDVARLTTEAPAMLIAGGLAIRGFL